LSNKSIESGDYLRKFSNWSIWDKMQIQNNFIKYTYCEIWDKNTIFITGSLLLGAIYSIFIMIEKIIKKYNKNGKLQVKLTIKGNEKMTFRIQEQIMVIDGGFFEMYYLEKNKDHNVEYCFNIINDNEINQFTNRFLELFTSENPRSKEPYPFAKIEETRKFYDLLLTNEYYLVIDN